MINRITAYLICALLSCICATTQAQPSSAEKDAYRKILHDGKLKAYRIGQLVTDDFLEQINTAESLFPNYSGATIFEQTDQIWLYRLCALYASANRYDRLTRCLDALDNSITANGEPKLTIESRVGFSSQIYRLPPNYTYEEYPLSAGSFLLRAQVALDSGDYKKALESTFAADKLIPWGNGKASILNWINSNGDPQDLKEILDYPNNKTGIFFTVDGDFNTTSIVFNNGAASLKGYWTKRVLLIVVPAFFKSDDSKKVAKIREILKTLAPIDVVKDKNSFLMLYSNPRMAANLFWPPSANKTENIAKERRFISTIYSSLQEYRLALNQIVLIPEEVELTWREEVDLFRYRKTSGKINQQTQFQRGDLRLLLGRASEAKSDLESVLKDPVFKQMASLYWAALYDRGRISESEGKPEEAAGYYRQAIEEIERQRSSINSEGARMGFFGDRQAVYQALTKLLFQSGKFEEAFLITERSKARALVDMLSSKNDFKADTAQQGKVEALLAQQKDVTLALAGSTSLPPDLEAKAIRSLKEVSTSATPEQQASQVNAIASDIRGALVAQERQQRTELSSIAPELSSLVSVAQVSLADIRAKLPAGETVLSYFSDKDNLYAFVLDAKTVTGVKLNRAGLAESVEELRTAIGKQDKSYQKPAQALYDRLIKPVTSLIKTDKLIIAPHGTLHYVPFSALLSDNTFLIDQYQLSYLPSASTLKYLGKDTTSAKQGTLLAFGNPDLGNPKYDLEFAESEAKQVAALFPRSVVFVRKEANKAHLQDFGGGFKYLHFATHGTFNTDHPLESALMLSTASIANASDRLSASDLYSMHLNADLVTLSACETGLSKVATGDEVVGLVRGFLFAGANSVISTLWSIDDAATAKLMTTFYSNLKAGKSKVDALRLAQRSIKSSEFDHPYYWAAFQMTGEPM